jgi:hypothetical protein
MREAIDDLYLHIIMVACAHEQKAHGQSFIPYCACARGPARASLS